MSATVSEVSGMSDEFPATATGDQPDKGRIGLHELVIADDAAKKLIQELARVAELFASASAAACGR